MPLVPSVSSSHAGWRWIACLLAMTATAGVAQAQLTAKSLIGDSVSNPEDPRYADVAEAIRRFENRDVLSAEKFLEDVKEKNKKLPPVGVMMAKMYAATGNSASVRPALEKSIDTESEDPEPYLLLAETNLRANQTIEADALFDKAVSLAEKYNANPKRKRQLQIRAYSGRAAVAQRRKNWKAAEADIRVWLEQAPDDAAGLQSLGQVLCMLDQVDEGRKAFVKATEINDKLPNAFVLTATMLERRGLLTDAINEFTKAYREDPKNETTLVTFAQSLVRAGELEKANKVLKAARDAAPGSFTVWLLSGVAERMSGRPEAAERNLLQALSIQPGSREAYDQIAQLLANQEDEGDRKRALQYALTCSKVFPNSADVKVTLAWALYQNGRNREATNALRNALQTGGGALSADARLLVAKLLLAVNQTDNARRLLSSAIANETGIFVQRAEAEELLKSLN
ncbi:MAG: tetratricopeptide repeat protein [Planctomycetota bacterium]